MSGNAQPSVPPPIAAVIAVLIRGEQVLLVRRSNRPDAGLWGFPGGKIEAGETLHAAALRELQEETGVSARAREAFAAVDVFDRDAAGMLRRHFVLVAVLCEWLAGEPHAADDAEEARWFTLAEMCDPRLPKSKDVEEVARRAAGIVNRSTRGGAPPA